MFVYLHSSCHLSFNLINQDIKPGNILLSSRGDICLADFGSCKMFASPDRNMSVQACTLWYRAPELLWGSLSYGSAADMWSIGCVMAELLLRRPLFQGDRELAMLQQMVAVLGSPSQEDDAVLQALPNYVRFEQRSASDFIKLFPAASAEAIDLITNLLQLNPSKRWSAEKCLQHRWFSVAPEPTSPSELPLPASKDASV